MGDIYNSHYDGDVGLFETLIRKSESVYNDRLKCICLIKSFPIFRTIDFCKKVPILSHLQIPMYILKKLFYKNCTTLQIKSGITPTVACQIALKSTEYIVLFYY